MKHLEDRSLTTQIIEKEIFLTRIRQLEGVYGMSWTEFLESWRTEDFRNKVADSNCDQYADFSEWAFLCTTMLTDLLFQDTFDESAVDRCQDSSIDRKPDRDRAFAFKRGIFRWTWWDIRNIGIESGAHCIIVISSGIRISTSPSVSILRKNIGRKLNWRSRCGLAIHRG
jgi:hypothetical protein